MSPWSPAFELVLGLLALGQVIALVRLVRGRTLVDRVVAMDVIVLLAVGMAWSLALGLGVDALLIAGVVLGLVGFMATLAYANIIEKAAAEHDHPPVDPENEDGGPGQP